MSLLEEEGEEKVQALEKRKMEGGREGSSGRVSLSFPLSKGEGRIELSEVAEATLL